MKKLEKEKERLKTVMNVQRQQYMVKKTLGNGRRRRVTVPKTVTE